MAKPKNCKPVELWTQLPLFPDAERELHRLNAVKALPDLPGWIGYPIRFGVGAHASTHGQ